MDDYSGFEPQVGEILALRTFRIGAGGVLYPVFGNAPWMPGTNTAACRVNGPLEGHEAHRAPEPGCTCGFYAFGTEQATADYAHARHVLGVVSCWGRIIAGTRGLRAEHCRVQALWMSSAVPPALKAEVAARYESTRIYDQREQMVEQFCPTALDCYEPLSRQRGGLSAVGLRLVVIVALVLGVLPPAVLDGNRAAHWAWVAEVCVLVASAFVLRRRRSDLGSRRLLLLLLSLLLWIAAPFAGVAGVFLLRLPMIQIFLLTLVQRQLIQRAAGRFPAQID